MELTVENLFKKYENSSQRWILPIPVIKDGQLKLICFMNHSEDRECETFDAYYIYNINLLVLHNFLMETSNGQAYWKYVRSKKPRTSFLDFTDHRTKTHITKKDVYRKIKEGHTEYILNLIDKRFNEINHTFNMMDLNEAKSQENELADLGYDY